MLKAVLTALAKAAAKDGEGASKLIEAHTSGAVTDEAARMISKTIVGSPLVKTALFGKDPNWGVSYVQWAIVGSRSTQQRYRLH